MATSTVPRLLTADEYAELDDVPGFRDELIEGERVLSPNPAFLHGDLIEHLAEILKAQLPNLAPHPLRVVAERSWKFRHPVTQIESVPVPDLMVISQDEAKKAQRSKKWFTGQPLLVVEIISPSERKGNRLRKVALYFDMGAPAVVEVDPEKRIVLIHMLTADMPALYRTGQQITQPFTAAVDDIFSVLD